MVLPPSGTRSYPSSLPDAPRFSLCRGSGSGTPLNLALCLAPMLRRTGLTTCNGDSSPNAPAIKQPCAKQFDFGAALWLSCNKKIPTKQGNRAVDTSDASKEEREQGSAFQPKFDEDGLLSAVVIDVRTGAVLMVAFMDAEALAATRETGFAHFHSRSRGRLWKKGESSGNVLAVEEILVDCDQDALVLRCRPAGPTCHTGMRSCFYRRLEGDTLHRAIP